MTSLGFVAKATSPQIDQSWSARVLRDGYLHIHAALPRIGIPPETSAILLDKLMRLDLTLYQDFGINVVFTASGDMSVAELVLGPSALNHLINQATKAHLFVAIPGTAHEACNAKKQDLSEDNQWASKMSGRLSSLEIQCEAVRRGLSSVPYASSTDYPDNNPAVVTVLGSVVPVGGRGCCKEVAAFIKDWDCRQLVEENPETCCAFQATYNPKNVKTFNSAFTAVVKHVVRLIGAPKQAPLFSAQPVWKFSKVDVGEPFVERAAECVEKNRISFVTGLGSTELLHTYATTYAEPRDDLVVLFHDFASCGAATHVRMAALSLLNQINPEEFSAGEVAKLTPANAITVYMRALKRYALNNQDQTIAVAVANIEAIVDRAPIEDVHDTLPQDLAWLGWKGLPENVRFICGTQAALQPPRPSQTPGNERSQKAPRFLQSHGKLGVNIIDLAENKKAVLDTTFARMNTTLPLRLRETARVLKKEVSDGDISGDVVAKMIELLYLDTEAEDSDFQALLCKLDEQLANSSIFAHAWSVCNEAAELLSEPLGSNFLPRTLQLIAATEAGLSMFDLVRLFRISKVDPMYLNCVLHIISPFTHMIRGRLCLDLGHFSAFALSKLGDGVAEGVAIAMLITSQWKMKTDAAQPAFRLIIERPHASYIEYGTKTKALEIFQDEEYLKLIYPTKELNLEGMNLDQSKGEILGKVLTKVGKNYPRISLYNNALQSRCLQQTVTQLSTKHLAFLNLGRNSLGDAGVKVLFSFVCHSCVKKLFIRGNGITSRGAAIVAEKLNYCPFLEHLNLGQNPLGDKGVGVLCKALRDEDNTAIALTALGLDNAEMTDSGVVSVLKVIALKRDIVFDLRGNRFKGDLQLNLGS